MPKLKGANLALPPKIGLYGAAGTGKTAFCLTGGEKVLYMDLNQGIVTGQHLNDRWKEQRGKVEFVQVFETDPKKAIAYKKALSFIDSWYDLAVAKKLGYTIVVVDSLTDLSEYALREVMSVNGGVNALPQIQHWGMIIKLMEKFLWTVRAFPCVVIVVAHQQSRDESGIDKIEMAIPGKKLPNQIASYLDEVWHTNVKKVKGVTQFLIETISTPTITARTRRNVPTNTMLNLGLIEVLRLAGYELPKVAQV